MTNPTLTPEEEAAITLKHRGIVESRKYYEKMILESSSDEVSRRLHLVVNAFEKMFNSQPEE